MFNITINTNGLQYPAAPGSFENFRKDVELDDSGYTVKSLSKVEIQNFKPNNILDIEIDEDGNIAKKKWIIAKVDKKLVSRITDNYDLTIDAIEYTAKLQNDVVIGKSFIQPNVTDRTIIRYTGLDVLERLLFDSNLYTDDTEYTIDEETKSLLSFRSPDFRFQDVTLYEAIADLFSQIDAVPRVEYDYDLQKDVIKADLLNKRESEINKSANVENRRITQDSEDNVTQLITRIQNVVDTTKNIISYPSGDYFLGPKTDAGFLDKNSNAYLASGAAIYDLDALIFDYFSIIERDKVQIEGKADGDSFEITLADIDPIINSTYPNIRIDCVDNVFESEAYAILDSDDGKVTSGQTTANTLVFTRGKANIRGINLDDREWYLNDTDIIYNVIFTSMFKNADFIAALKTHLGATTLTELTYDEDVIDPLLSPFRADNFADTGWKVLFVSSKDYLINTTRVNDLETRKGNGSFFAKFNNQSERLVDVEKVSYNTISLIERLGLEEESFSNVVKTAADLNQVGDYDGSSIVTIASYKYNKNSIEASYTLNNKYTKLSSNIGTDSAIRTTNISEDNSVEKVSSTKVFLILDDTKNVQKNDTSFVQDEFLNEFLNTEALEDRTMIYEPIRSGLDFKGNEKYTDNIGTARLVAPFDIKVIGRTLILAATFDSVVSAGDFIEFGTRNKIPINMTYSGTDVRYQGEYELANYSIGFGTTDTFVDHRKLPLITNTFSVPPINLTDQYIEKNRINVFHKELYKDRGERVTEQFEIEAKAATSDIVIYPAFVESNKLANGSSTYKAKLLNVGNITLSTRNISQISGSNIASEVSITKVIEEFSAGFELINSGKPYVVFDEVTGNILLANNNPLADSVDSTKTGIYYRMIDELGQVVTFGALLRFIFGLNTYTGTNSYKIDPNAANSSVSTSDNTKIGIDGNGEPVFVEAGVEHDLELSLSSLLTALGTIEPEEGVYDSIYSDTNNQDLFPIAPQDESGNGKSFTGGNGIDYISFFPLAFPDAIYDIELDYSIVLDSEIGEINPPVDIVAFSEYDSGDVTNIVGSNFTALRIGDGDTDPHGTDDPLELVRTDNFTFTVKGNPGNVIVTYENSIHGRETSGVDSVDVYYRVNDEDHVFIGNINSFTRQVLTSAPFATDTGDEIRFYGIKQSTGLSVWLGRFAFGTASKNVPQSQTTTVLKIGAYNTASDIVDNTPTEILAEIEFTSSGLKTGKLNVIDFEPEFANKDTRVVAVLENRAVRGKTLNHTSINVQYVVDSTLVFDESVDLTVEVNSKKLIDIKMPIEGTIFETVKYTPVADDLNKPIEILMNVNGQIEIVSIGIIRVDGGSLNITRPPE